MDVGERDRARVDEDVDVERHADGDGETTNEGRTGVVREVLRRARGTRGENDVE